MADSSQSPIQEEPGVKITFHFDSAACRSSTHLQKVVSATRKMLAWTSYYATIIIQIGSFAAPDVRGVICLRAVTAVCSSHTYRWSLSW